MIGSQPQHRDRKLLDIARDAPCMLMIEGVCRSMVNPSVPCHSNLQRHGRGYSFKSHDCFAVPGCNECHYELDSGKNLSREQKENYFMAALERYILWLWQNDRIMVA